MAEGNHMYNYTKAMAQDIREYIADEIELGGYDDREKLEDELNERLWMTDSVTGNASGSYTFSRAIAKDYVIDNMDALVEACENFGIMPELIGKKFLEEDWEWMDVTIRCHLLPFVISEVIDDLNI